MRIDQLPVAASVSNTNTLPVSVDGLTKQVNIGNLTNSIRDNVYGAPLTASTSSAMTDQTRVYVYTGTTSGGYTNGHWYYYNGSAWTDGGAYNSSAVQTDPTLTLEGVPADAKATGELKAVIDDKLAEFDVAIETFYPHSGGVGNIVTVEGTVDAPPAELVIYGKSVQSGTPTPSAPVNIVTAGSGGTLPMVSVGKNLLDVAGFTQDSGSSISRIDAQSGTIVVVSSGGTYRGASNHSIVLLPGVAYVCSGNVAGADGGVSRVAIRNAANTIKASNTTGAAGAFSFTFTPTDPGWYVTVFASLGTSATGSVTYTGLQIEVAADVAAAATGFAPYKAATAAIPTPNGLPGIAVGSGGNYTDENGQQWICDTIDLAAGTYTKRVGQVRFGDITDISAGSGFFRAALPQPHAGTAQAVMCSCYATSPTATSSAGLADGEIICNPSNTSYVIFKDSRYTSSQVADLKAAIANQYLVYVLATPVITALTEEQIAALRSLRGVRGVTNMFSTDPTNPDIGANLYIDIPTYIQGLMGGGTRRTLAAANLGAQADTGAEVPGDESAEVLEDESAEAMANVSDETADIDGEQSEDIDGDVETV